MHSQLNRIRTFMAVVDAGSFTRAAERLLISKSMASVHVKSLEEHLGIALLVRNPRGLSMTEAGEALYRDFTHIFGSIQQSLDSVAEHHHSLSGTLRLTATAEFGERFILPLLGKFCRAHPRLKVSYHADSSLNDMISERLDLAVRLGRLQDSSLRSRRLARFDILLVAAPRWLEHHPLNAVADLNGADWIANTNLKAPTHWVLRHSSQPDFTLRATARFHANSSAAIRAMTLAGLGVAILPKWMVDEDIEQGRLVQLFPEYCLPRQDVTLLFPGDHKVHRKCRVFIDFLVQHLRL